MRNLKREMRRSLHHYLDTKTGSLRCPFVYQQNLFAVILSEAKDPEVLIRVNGGQILRFRLRMTNDRVYRHTNGQHVLPIAALMLLWKPRTLHILCPDDTPAFPPMPRSVNHARPNWGKAHSPRQTNMSLAAQASASPLRRNSGLVSTSISIPLSYTV